MEKPCPDELRKGIDLFNKQEFFECHEVLEDFWRQQQTDDRQLTQGIIQIAVGYYHLSQNNKPGTIKLFESGLTKIAPYVPTYFQVSVERLLNDVTLSLNRLSQGLAIEQVPTIFFANPPQ